MTLNKSQASSRITDPVTGKQAAVNLKADGTTQALEVIAEVPAGNIVEIKDEFGSNYAAQCSRTNISYGTGSYTTIYTRSGAGSFESFWLETENEKLSVKMTIDGTEIFDIDCRVFKDSNIDKEHTIMNKMPFVYDNDKTVAFRPGKLIRYETSVTISVKGEGDSKAIQGWCISEVRD